jgi:hypothetical protein
MSLRFNFKSGRFTRAVSAPPAVFDVVDTVVVPVVDVVPEPIVDVPEPIVDVPEPVVDVPEPVVDVVPESIVETAPEPVMKEYDDIEEVPVYDEDYD